MKNTLLLVAFLWFTGSLSAQHGKVVRILDKARSEVNAGRCETGIALLEKYSDLLGDTSSISEFLRAKCSFQVQRYESARYHVMAYMMLQKDTSSDDYREVKNIGNQLSISFDKRDTSGLENGGFDEAKTWEIAFRSNDIKAYRNYIRFFPNGIHIEAAKKVVDYYDTKENSPSKLIVDAVRNSNWPLITELVKKGADVNYVEVHRTVTDRADGKMTEYYFETPLSIACMKFDLTMVKYLLAQGADPNRFMYRRYNDHDKAPERSRTILETMITATSKNGVYSGQDTKLIDFIDLMLHSGLDVNFYQGSAIATAVYFHDPKNYRRYTLVRYLMRKGADPSLHGDNALEKSAIQIASERGDKTMLAILKDKRYKQLRRKLQDDKKTATVAKPGTATK